MSSSSTTNPGPQPSEGYANQAYKDQLDETAHRVKYGAQNNANEGGLVSQVTEKVSQYVPAVGKVLGTENKKEQDNSVSPSAPGPPDRPHHDTQIEEFVRDVHRSKTEEGTLADE